MLAGTLVLAGCGGGSDDPTPPPVVVPTPFEAAKAAIAAAATGAEAQAAYDAVKDDVTAAQGEQLQAAVNDRVAALAKMAREATQKANLMTVAGNVDTSDLETAEDIAAANNAIAKLQAALDMAADVSAADKEPYQTQLNNAEDEVETAQMALDKKGRVAAQRMAISSAVTAARSAVKAVDDASTDAEVMLADTAVAALQTAIDGAADLPEGDAEVASAQGTHETLVDQLASAKTSRTAAMDAADKAATKAMIAKAKVLYGTLGTPDNFTVTYGTGANAGKLQVASAIFLSEDKDATMASLIAARSAIAGSGVSTGGSAGSSLPPPQPARARVPASITAAITRDLRHELFGKWAYPNKDTRSFTRSDFGHTAHGRAWDSDGPRYRQQAGPDIPRDRMVIAVRDRRCIANDRHRDKRAGKHKLRSGVQKSRRPTTPSATLKPATMVAFCHLRTGASSSKR